MTAAKFTDPVLGIDVHLVIIPSPPGTAPLPHPFVGVVYDPLGAAVGAAFGAIFGGGGPVFVNGMPTGNTGTEAVNIPHFPTPPGTGPAPGDAPPDNEGTLLTGSKTVHFAGASQSRELSVAISCSFPVALPTSVVAPVPHGKPVNIGGPEAVDMMVAATAAAGAALKYAKGKWGKQASEWLNKKLKAPKGSKRSKVICFLTGHPVDVVSGELIADAIDFELGGSVMPLVWERNYRSREGRHPLLPTLSTSLVARSPALGPAWFHPFDSWIEEEAGGSAVHLRGADGRPKTFHGLSHPGDSDWDPEDRETLYRTAQGYELGLADGRRWAFRALDGATPRGVNRRVLLPIAISDPSDNRIELHYERGYLRFIIDAAGRVFDVRWGEDHRIREIWLVGSVPPRISDSTQLANAPIRDLEPLPKPLRLVAYRYESGELTHAIDAENHAMRYAWSGGVIVEEVHKGGLTFRFAWDFDHPDGDCIRTWGENPSFDPSPGAENGVPRFIYDRRIRYMKERKLTTVEDGRGGTTRYFTNDLGLVDKVIDPLGVVTEYAYRPETWKVSEKDGLGNETKWEHDDRGRVVREIDPLGNVTEWKHDAAGNVLEMTNALGGKTTIAWDHRRCPQAMTNPAGDVTRFTFDERGRPSVVQDPMGRTMRYEWTARHEAAVVLDAEGRASQHQYDGMGRLIGSRDPLGRPLVVQRNLVGEPVAVSLPDGERLILVRDDDGNVVERTDSLGRRIAMRYAGLGKLVEHTDAMGYRVQLRYDADEELVSVTNQAGDSYDFELDVAGRLKVERTFSGTRRHFLYDKAGRVKQVTSGGHRVIKLERDGLGRVIAQATTSPVLGGAPTEETFRYDPLGDLVGAMTPGGHVSLARDVLGRIVDETTRVEATATTASVRNVFDRSGLRIERATSMAHRTSYRYDRTGDLVGVAAGWQLPGAALKKLPQAALGDFEITLARDAIGQEIARRLPGGVASRWGRDGFGRPTEQRVVTGASGQSQGRDIMRKGYAWSAPDQIASMFDLDASGHARGGSRYEHDPRGYLIRQIFSDGTELHRAADPVGNLFRSAEMNDRVYGKGGVLKRVGSTEVEHDADGNLIKKTLVDGAVWQYRWDAQGRLSSVSRPDGKEVSFSYDAFGRRLSKTFDGRTTEYIWDGNDLVHERVREGEASSVLTTWVFEPGTFAPLAKIEGRKRFGVVSDHLGTPVVLTTEAGALAWKAQLDIYGVPREETSGVADADRTANPWRFPGQYEDAETGLYYNRFRYYDPALGRYLSEDPIGLAGGAALFGYVGSTVTAIDPFGLTSCDLASSRPVIRPGTPEWKTAVKQLGSPGMNTNFRVGSEAEARRLLMEGRGELTQFGTYTDEYYKKGFEIHPNEKDSLRAPHNDLPHIKWKDWSGGKAEGSKGHIFFDE